MFLNLENAHSNVFHTAKFSQISYRIYVSLFSNEHNLLQAEWTLRRDYENALVKCVHNELWTFSFSETEPPPIPHEKFNLKEISTGVFLPSMLSSTNLTSPSQTFPVSYVPFILAVKQLVYSQLVSQQHFVPFGRKCILAPTKGKLLYIEPKLFAGGEMIFRIYYKQSGLAVLNLKSQSSASRSSMPLASPVMESVKLGSTKVIIAPCAIVATLIEVSLPPPPNVDQFIKMLSLFSGASLNSRRDWVKLLISQDPNNSGEMPTELLWPADLCFFKPSRTDPDVILKNDLSWFETPDILDGLEKQVISLKGVISMTKNENDNDKPESKLMNQNMFMNLGKDLTSLQPSAASIISSEIKKPRSIYPTPPGFQPKPQLLKDDNNNNNNDNNSLDNGFNNPDNVDSASWDATPGGGIGTVGPESWDDLDEELFGDGDEVTEADFNFFDQPGSEEEKNYNEINEEKAINAHVASTDKVANGQKNVIGGENESEMINDSSHLHTMKAPPTISEMYIPEKSRPLFINGFDDDVLSTELIESESKPLTSTVSSLVKTASKRIDSCFHIFPLVTQKRTEDKNEDFEKRKRRMTSFTSIEFNPRIASEIDKKYTTGGKFHVPENDFEKGLTESSSEDDEEPASIIQGKTSMLPLFLKNDILMNDHGKNNESLVPTNPSAADISKYYPFSPLRKRRFDNDMASQNSPSPITNNTDHCLTNAWLPFLSQFSEADDALENLNAISSSNLTHVLSSRNYDPVIFNNIIQLLAVQIVWDNSLLSSYIPSTSTTEQPDVKVIQSISNIFTNTYRMSLFEFIRISDSLKPPTSQDSLVHQQNIKGDRDSAKMPAVAIASSEIESNSVNTKQISAYNSDSLEGLNGSKDTFSSITIEPLPLTSALSTKSGFDESTRVDEGFNSSNIDNEKNNIKTTASTNKEDEKFTLKNNNQTASSDYNRINPNNGNDKTKHSFNNSTINNDPNPEESKVVSRISNKNDFALYLSSPMFTFRRTNQIIKASPPAIRFWKTFGFSPLYGCKNINLFMVYPGSPGVNTAARMFLESIKTCYEGSGLGDVTLSQADRINKHGLIPIHLNIEKPTVPETIDIFRNKLHTIFEKNKQVRASPTPNSSTEHTILLVANPFSTLSSLLDFGHCLQQLQDLDSENQSGITVQLLPMDLFAEKDSMVIMPQYKLVKLALSIYDKIPSSGTELTAQMTIPAELFSSMSDDYQRSSPAFTLSKSPLSILNFKLTDRPSISALYEDTFIHLAYAYSDDKRWVTVAWSDQWGQNSRVEAFCLLPQGMRPRAFEDVCAEIWEKTMELTSSVAAHRYIACAKIGTVEEDEISMWLRFAFNTNSVDDGTMNTNVTGIGNSSNIPNDPNPSSLKYKRVSLIFVSVNIQSSLIITGDHIFKHNQSGNALTRRRGYTGATGPPSSTTPTFMTPQRTGDSIESPDMYGTNVATPGSQGFNDQENMNNQELKEGDLSILDIMDETCGIILHHRIPIGKTRDRLSLITGYLLKPKSDGGSDEGTGNRTPLYGVNSSTDFLASIEISIVNSPIPSLFALKVLLKQYRNLASLGFVSGVTNKQNSLIPWHISACDKMLRVFTNVY